MEALTIHAAILLNIYIIWEVEEAVRRKTESLLI